jgi:transposase
LTVKVGRLAAYGASVAGVALSHGINANIVHRWLREHAGTALVVQAPNEFVALTVDETAMPSAIAQPKPDIRVEVRRGNSAIVVSWPVQEASSCAAWLREWLK